MKTFSFRLYCTSTVGIVYCVVCIFKYACLDLYVVIESYGHCGQLYIVHIPLCVHTHPLIRTKFALKLLGTIEA